MSGKVETLMAQMTLREKIGQLNLITPGGGILTGSSVNGDVEAKIGRGEVGGIFGLKSQDKIMQTQKLAVETSRLGIPILFAEDIIHGFKDPIFPLPLAMASSWNPEMVRKTAQIAALQAAAEGLNQTYSPMVDVCRDPRWGRIAEGFGEDPLLTARMAVAMVEGYQGSDLSSVETILACVKHFAAYGAAQGGRDYNSVDISPQELHTSILPPFEAAVRAGAASMMASFNDINAMPSHGNEDLLTTLLRQKWGFLGFMVGDYTGVQEMTNHGLGDYQTVAAQALKAGLDMDMVDELFLTTLEQAMKEGRVSQQQIDTACRRVLEAKDHLGLLDDPYRYINQDRLIQVSNRKAEFRAVARQAVSQSCVLLKNDQTVLPLRKSGTVGLIGPLGDSRENMMGTWAVAGNWNDCVTLREGLEKAGGGNITILVAKGANIVDDPELARRLNCHGDTVFIDPRSREEMIEEAVAVARKSDVVILAVGEAKEQSGESSSVTDIRIPGSQPELIKAVLAVGKPTALVVMSGRPLALEDEDRIVGTILWAPFGGTETGNGLADILFGDCNPSGKLPVTFPRHVGQIPIHYAHKKTGRPMTLGAEWEKFRTGYLDRKSTPLYAFGHGLSYTQFDYSPVRLSHVSRRGQQKLTASVDITNIGERNGEEIVQLYITDPVASQTRPVRELKGFEKIALQPGETKTVMFEITPDDLRFSVAHSISDTRRIWEPGEFIIQIGPASDKGNVASVEWEKPQRKNGMSPK